MKKFSHGFTLIELSIVLVIIALVIGAVLVGRDLIETAQLRKLVSAKAEVSTAINAFRNKYGGTPGDLSKAAVDQFGLATCANACCGNGNGLIEPITGAGGPISFEFSCEVPLFWKHLTQAGMYNSTVDASAPITATGVPNPVTVTLSESLRYTPKSPVNGALLIRGIRATYPPGLGVAQILGLNSGTVGTAAALTPLQTFYIDSKIDNGRPATGQVLSFAPTPPDFMDTGGGVPTGNYTVDPNDFECAIFSVALNDFVYNYGGPIANRVACGLFMTLPEIGGR